MFESAAALDWSVSVSANRFAKCCDAGRLVTWLVLIEAWYWETVAMQAGGFARSVDRLV